MFVLCAYAAYTSVKKNSDTTCHEDTRYHDGNIPIPAQTQRCDEDYWGILSVRACVSVTKKSEPKMIFILEMCTKTAIAIDTRPFYRFQLTSQPVNG